MEFTDRLRTARTLSTFQIQLTAPRFTRYQVGTNLIGQGIVLNEQDIIGFDPKACTRTTRA